MHGGACGRCTFFNDAAARRCTMCGYSLLRRATLHASASAAVAPPSAQTILAPPSAETRSSQAGSDNGCADESMLSHRRHGSGNAASTATVRSSDGSGRADDARNRGRETMKRARVRDMNTHRRRAAGGGSTTNDELCVGEEGSNTSLYSDGFESAREHPDTLCERSAARHTHPPPVPARLGPDRSSQSLTISDSDDDVSSRSSHTRSSNDSSTDDSEDDADEQEGSGGSADDEANADEDAELNNRNLVHFLQTLQCAAHEQLACASVPSSMRDTAELRPFQLQALQWMLQREHRPSPPHRHGAARNMFSSTTTMTNDGLNTMARLAGRGDADSDVILFGDATEPAAHASSALALGRHYPDTMLHCSDMNTVRGGILADYMGLGKTRTVVALCEATRGPRLDCVTGSQVYSHATLIICPTALLAQWGDEIRRCVQPTPRILLYYGSRKRHCSLFDVAQKFDYVLTTYQTLRHEPDIRADSPGKLYMIQWQRVVLDEAHYIRNARTQQSRACLQLSGTYRWAVTATPVQNSVNDLFVLLRFLQVPHFSSYQWWNREIVRFLNENPQHPRPITALRILFSALLLRRTPATRVNGTPILDLPMKSVVTRRIRLGEVQQKFYESIQRMAARKLSLLQQPRSGTAAWGAEAMSPEAGPQLSSPFSPASRTFATALEMLVRCRQACLHPYIVVAALRGVMLARQRHGHRWTHQMTNSSRHGRGSNERYEHNSQTNNNNENNTEHGSGLGAMSNRSQHCCVTAEDKACDNAARRTNGHAPSVTNGTASMAKQQCDTDAALQRYIDHTLCKKINAKSASFVHELIQSLREYKLDQQECIICMEKMHNPAILPCAHTFCASCIAHALEVKRVCPLCKQATRPIQVLLVPLHFLHTPRGGSSTPSSSDSASGTGSARGQGGSDEYSMLSICDAAVNLTDYVQWPVEMSAKTQELLLAITSLPATEKVVVFSAFDTYLLYAQHALRQAGVTCERYTGALSMRQRAQLLHRFDRDDILDTSEHSAKSNSSSDSGSCDAVSYRAARDGEDKEDTAAAVRVDGSHVPSGRSSTPADTPFTSNGAVRETHAAREARSVSDANAPTSNTRSFRVLLATIATCGVGLNLTRANHCFVMEPTWNAGTEEQAINRVYRIGQTRDVTVTRFVARDTVEEKMEALCQRKRELMGFCVHGAESEQESMGCMVNRLSTRELLALFVDANEQTGRSDSRAKSDNDARDR